MRSTSPVSSAASPGAGLGVLTVILTLVGWASVPLFLRHFAHSIDFWTSNGWRYGFSAMVWAPVLIWFALRGRARGLPKGLWIAALVPSVVNAAGQVCFTWAHYRIEPGLVTFGLRTQLLFVAIGAWLLFPAERVIIRRPGYIIGAVILLIGMSVVILMADTEKRIDDVRMVPAQAEIDDSTAVVRDGAELEQMTALDSRKRGNDAAVLSQSPMPNTGLAHPGDRVAHIQGVVLAIASGLLFAAYGLAVRKYMYGVNSVLAFAAICQYTALAMVILMFIFGQRYGLTVLDLPNSQIMWLLISALIGIAIGHVFYYYSIARLGVAVTAGVIQLQPFLVAVASFSLFGEVLNAWQWLGGTVAVSGALMMLNVQWKLSQRRPKLEEPVAIAEGESGS